MSDFISLNVELEKDAQENILVQIFHQTQKRQK